MTALEIGSRLCSAEELFEFPDDLHYELVKGRLREMTPPGGSHGYSTIGLSSPIAAFVEENDLGVCFAAETGFLIERDPDTVLAPDFGFISAERAPRPVTEKYVPVVPDLVVETTSPSDTRRQVAEKVREWLDAGARMVLELGPKSRALIVHRPGRPSTVLQASDTFSGEDVLPGFTRPVARLFM